MSRISLRCLGSLGNFYLAAAAQTQACWRKIKRIPKGTPSFEFPLRPGGLVFVGSLDPKARELPAKRSSFPPRSPVHRTGPRRAFPTGARHRNIGAGYP
ncbi:MAG TPA: hypothetical protein VGG02_10880 [Chthoniobacterales bacterium]